MIPFPPTATPYTYDRYVVLYDDQIWETYQIPAGDSPNDHPEIFSSSHVAGWFMDLSSAAEPNEQDH